MIIHTLPLGDYQTNCYIAYAPESKSCAVIDPGYFPERILSFLADKGLSVDAILLTHGHFDHVGAVRDMVAETDCPVYLHEQELSQPEQMTAGPLYYTHTYGEGDVLKLAGLSLRVLHTPGHTPGSVCLQAEGVLFSGDTLFQSSIGRTDFPGGSFPQMQKSLRRLKEIPENLRVLPGHGPATTLEEERMFNPYLH